jgi:tetratricopeptide (TPR) repeat protein
VCIVTTEPGTSNGELCAVADEGLAEAAFRTGEFGDVERLYGEALSMARLHDDRKAEARALGGLGMVRHHRCIARLVAGRTPDDADVAAEEELMRGALASWLETGDAVGTARGLFGMGLVFQVLHRDWAAAMPYYWQAYGLAEAVEESGDLYACSEIHRHLGFYYLIEDVRPAEAVRRLGYSLALRERLGDPRGIPSGLVALGEAELAAGQPQRAVELLGRAARLARSAGLAPWRTEDAERSLAEAEAALGETRG